MRTNAPVGIPGTRGRGVGAALARPDLGALIVLGDRAALREGVVIVGIEALPGARVLVAAGTRVVSVGESSFDGTFIAFVEKPA